jgi:peroxiredoxin
MSRLLPLLLALTASPACATEPAAATVAAAAHIGAPAPDFDLTAVDGKHVKLSDLRGKIVVLEWFNPGCPFVQQSHGPGGVLEGLAAKHPEVTWLAINSGAPGKEGSGRDVNATAAGGWKMDYPILLDEAGAAGRAYGAKSTPQMAIIDASGALVYAGAIDNAPLGKVTGTHTNYVEKALAEIAAGKPVSTPETKSYGCSVKY